MGRIRQVESDLPRIFGRGMRSIREYRAMNQETLGHAVGYGDHSQIAKIEKGKTVPSFGQAIRLAAILDVTLEAIMRAGRGEIWETELPGVPESFTNLIIAQCQQVKTKTSELVQEIDHLEALVQTPLPPPDFPPTPLPGSGLELFEPLPAFPDYRLAACA